VHVDRYQVRLGEHAREARVFAKSYLVPVDALPVASRVEV